jgi:hypothetical protein
LPAFADVGIATHYADLRDELVRRGSDSWTIENIDRILRANAALLRDRAPAPVAGAEVRIYISAAITCPAEHPCLLLPLATSTRCDYLH